MHRKPTPIIQKPFELDLFLQMGKHVMQCFRGKKGQACR